MNSCGFEKDLSQALRDGRWPAGCDPALRQHVAGCASCSDLLLVTGALQSARAATLSAAVLPPSGVLWWRAQVRRRNRAAERMARPIVFTEVAVLLAALVALVFVARRFVDWTALVDRLTSTNFQLADALSSLPAGIPLLLAIGALAVFLAAGFAVYSLAHNE